MISCVILFGPPGAGKGTQAALLESRLGFRHVSTGAVLRSQISQATSLGEEIRSLVERGDLVGDDLLMRSLGEFLRHNGSVKDDEIFLLDGVPRTVNQVGLLAETLSSLNWDLKGVVSFEASLPVLQDRFSTRLTCSGCGATFSSQKGFSVGGNCTVCDIEGSLARRKDDSPAAVERRFEIYESETRPVLSLLSKLVKVAKVDALRDPEEVFREVRSVLNSFNLNLASS